MSNFFSPLYSFLSSALSLSGFENRLHNLGKFFFLLLTELIILKCMRHIQFIKGNVFTDIDFTHQIRDSKALGNHDDCQS